MGVVYEAVQESLGRRVALKVLPRGTAAKSRYLERFAARPRSAARLHHTNIVPVFGVGEDKGTHYYVMQYIQGRSLDVVLAEVNRLRNAPDGHTGGGAASALQDASRSVGRSASGTLAGAKDATDPGEPAENPPAIQAIDLASRSGAAYFAPWPSWDFRPPRASPTPTPRAYYTGT